MRQRKKLCRHEESNLRPSDSALRSLSHRELDGERGPLRSSYILFACILLSLGNVSLSFLAVRNHSLFTAWDERKKNFFFFWGGGSHGFQRERGEGQNIKGDWENWLPLSLPPPLQVINIEQLLVWYFFIKLSSTLARMGTLYTESFKLIDLDLLLVSVS